MDVDAVQVRAELADSVEMLEVPMSLFGDAQRATALANHHISLESLARRGPIDVDDLVAILECRRRSPLTTEQALDRLERFLARAGGSG